MAQGFSNQPTTIWDIDNRKMILAMDLVYTDSKNKKWVAIKGSEINGATIPRQLWGTIGSPYIGRYRRASIVHDVHVGEGANPNVSKAYRSLADRMFHDACLYDGCTKKFARMLYIGVKIGTALSKNTKFFRTQEFIDTRKSPQSTEYDNEIIDKFWNIAEQDYSNNKIENNYRKSQSDLINIIDDDNNLDNLDLIDIEIKNSFPEFFLNDD